jgi:hypothetical protein
MKMTILCVSLAISAVAAYGQSVVGKAKGNTCARTGNKSFSARLKHYPFNLSSRVLLVSYVGLEPVSPGDSGYVNKGLPRENDSVCYSKLKEVKALTLPQVDRLTDILYNYGFPVSSHVITQMMCFMPHNAIIFIDKDGKTFAYIDICFLCEVAKMSSERISIGEVCSGKFELIRAFFEHVGIDYGVHSTFLP